MTTREEVEIYDWQMHELELASGRAADVAGDGHHELRVGHHLFITPPAVPAQRVAGAA